MDDLRADNERLKKELAEVREYAADLHRKGRQIEEARVAAVEELEILRRENFRFREALTKIYRQSKHAIMEKQR